MLSWDHEKENKLKEDFPVANNTLLGRDEHRKQRTERVTESVSREIKTSLLSLISIRLFPQIDMFAAQTNQIPQRPL